MLCLSFRSKRFFALPSFLCCRSLSIVVASITLDGEASVSPSSNVSQEDDDDADDDLTPRRWTLPLSNDVSGDIDNV